MKIGNTAKRSALCLGFIGTIYSSPINTGNNKRCLDIPQQHIEDITKENGVNIITANKHNLELMPNDEQKRFFDEKYYDVMTKNWDKFLSSMDSKDKEKNIEQVSGDLKKCINVKFIDAREQAGENYVWYKVAENINENELVVPLTKPILPGIDELNKMHKNDYLKDKIAYISKEEYNNCVEKEMLEVCEEHVGIKAFIKILGISSIICFCALNLNTVEKIQKVIDSFSNGFSKFNNELKKGINCISRKLFGREIIEREINMFDLDNNSTVSEDRTIGGNNIQEIDIVECDRDSEVTMFN